MSWTLTMPDFGQAGHPHRDMEVPEFLAAVSSDRTARRHQRDAYPEGFREAEREANPEKYETGGRSTSRR